MWSKLLISEKHGELGQTTWTVLDEYDKIFSKKALRYASQENEDGYRGVCMKIDQENLYQLFETTDERTQFEVVRMLEEHSRPYNQLTVEEMEKQNKELKEQVQFWQELFTREQKLHLFTLESSDRIIKEQQAVIDKLRKKQKYA